jgi:dolichol kinase
VFLSRKILHIGAISAVAHATFITPQAQLPMLSTLILTAAVLLTIAVFMGFFEIDGRKSWGIAYFPWVLFLMLLFQPERTEIIALSFAVLAVSDGLSALAGRYIQLPPKYRLYNATINGKTWVGFAVFVTSAWVVLMVYFGSQLL